MTPRIAYIIIAHTGDEATAVHYLTPDRSSFKSHPRMSEIAGLRARADTPVIRYDMAEDVELTGPRGIFGLPECYETDLPHCFSGPMVSLAEYIAEVKRRGYYVESLRDFRVWERAEITD